MRICFVSSAVAAPDFGRRLAALRGIETIGPVGAAAQTAPTVEAAFDIFGAFIRAHSPGLQVRLGPHGGGDNVFFEVRILVEPALRQRQAIELTLGASLQILRAILGPAYSPLSVHLPHSRLTPAADYVRYFGCRAHFAQPCAGFELRAADLRRRLEGDDIAHLVAVTRLRTLVDGSAPTMAQSVLDVARPLLPTGVLTIDVVAEHLGLHVRALQRRLAAEQTTFGALIDNLLRETAERLLRDTDLNLEHITRLLGYSEQSVLTRSCQRWFASSPTAYRDS